MGYRSSIVALACLALAVAGCSDDQPATAPTTASSISEPLAVPPAPEGDAFYLAPQPTGSERPGQLIWARRMPTPRGMRGYQILYWSSTVAGDLTAVSGMVYLPATIPPSGSAVSIVAWTHGTTGIADQCAPSKNPVGHEGPGSPFVGPVVAAGGLFVVTDYEGLGTPGDHPYLVARSAGINALDSVRAVLELVHGGPDSRAIVMGESQGGAAALLAAELQAEYAADLPLRGAVAISPVSHLDTVRRYLDRGDYVGYTFMAALGYEAAYPELAAGHRWLNDEGTAALDYMRQECSTHILQQFSGQSQRQFGFDRVLGAKDFQARMAENEPGRIRTEVPILIVHGQLDQIIPASTARALVRRYCGLDAAVTARFFRGLGHADVLTEAQAPIGDFIRDRLAGAPAGSSC